MHRVALGGNLIKIQAAVLLRQDALQAHQYGCRKHSRAVTSVQPKHEAAVPLRQDALQTPKPIAETWWCSHLCSAKRQESSECTGSLLAKSLLNDLNDRAATTFEQDALQSPQCG
jgi:hypothetical protein